MSALAARPAAQGLVRRGGDPADARVVLLGLTAEGAGRLARRRARRVDAALAALSPDGSAASPTRCRPSTVSPEHCADTNPPRR
ncbi:hypothetical protein [Geodermatophilus sp. SYSU D00698]